MLIVVTRVLLLRERWRRGWTILPGLLIEIGMLLLRRWGGWPI